jgi:hypothetical protein
MTKHLSSGLAAALVCGVLSWSATAVAGGRPVTHAPQTMSPVRAMTDDKCDAKCDEESDKCMTQAGHDASKQRLCDASYDDCLRKCQGS